jgi:hypothetical protein
MNQVNSDQFATFLIAEYEQGSETLLRNEEGGEKRATFFATLTGGTVAVTFVINALLFGALAATILDGILPIAGCVLPLGARVLLDAIVASAFSLLLWMLQCSMRTRDKKPAREEKPG